MLQSSTGFVVSGVPAWREAFATTDDQDLFNFSRPWNPEEYVSWGNID